MVPQGREDCRGGQVKSRGVAKAGGTRLPGLSHCGCWEDPVLLTLLLKVFWSEELIFLRKRRISHLEVDTQGHV